MPQRASWRSTSRAQAGEEGLIPYHHLCCCRGNVPGRGCCSAGVGFPVGEIGVNISERTQTGFSERLSVGVEAALVTLGTIICLQRSQAHCSRCLTSAFPTPASTNLGRVSRRMLAPGRFSVCIAATRCVPLPPSLSLPSSLSPSPSFPRPSFVFFAACGWDCCPSGWRRVEIGVVSRRGVDYCCDDMDPSWPFDNLSTAPTL
jgi:hypothetical protein